MFFILILILLYINTYPTLDIKKFNQYSEQIEQNFLEYRKSIDPIIRGELKELIYKTDAYRASIFEFHNGNSNFSSLGNLCATMTYEETKDNVDKISNFYREINLSLFNISNMIYKNGYWYGSIKDLQEIDPALYQGILSTSKTKYICIVLLESSNELGFLVLSFNEVPNNPQQIGRDIRRVGVSIASKLDYIPNVK